MLMIHESLMRFRVLLSVSNHKIYNFYQKFVFITFIFLREKLSVLVYLFSVR